MIPKYNAICGISETEFRQYFKLPIASFAEEHDISEEEAWKKFKLMYDGYHFASRGEGIYNPFSVINAFDENELKNFGMVVDHRPSTAEEALAQIYEKGYAIPFESDSRIVFLIGANFSTSTRTLDEWIIKKLK